MKKIVCLLFPSLLFGNVSISQKPLVDCDSILSKISSIPNNLTTTGFLDHFGLDVYETIDSLDRNVTKAKVSMIIFDTGAECSVFFEHLSLKSCRILILNLSETKCDSVFKYIRDYLKMPDQIVERDDSNDKIVLWSTSKKSQSNILNLFARFEGDFSYVSIGVEQ